MGLLTYFQYYHAEISKVYALQVLVVALLITAVMYKDKDKIKDYEDDGMGEVKGRFLNLRYRSVCVT